MDFGVLRREIDEPNIIITDWGAGCKREVWFLFECGRWRRGVTPGKPGTKWGGLRDATRGDATSGGIVRLTDAVKPAFHLGFFRLLNDASRTVRGERLRADGVVLRHVMVRYATLIVILK
jgi:hypothetical protein